MLKHLEQCVFDRATIALQDSPTQGGDNHIRTLPELVEYNAIHNSDYPFCVQVRAVNHGVNGHSKTSNGIQTIIISHSQLRKSIQHCSSHLKDTVKELELPVCGNDGTIRKGAPVALFVESDVGLLIYKLSLMSLGVPVRTIHLGFLPPIISQSSLWEGHIPSKSRY